MSNEAVVTSLAAMLLAIKDPYAADVLYYEHVEDEDYHACLKESRLTNAARDWIRAMLELDIAERWQVWELAYPDPTPITVAELVRRLTLFPPDAPVLFCTGRDTAEAATTPEIRLMAKRVRSDWVTSSTYHDADEHLAELELIGEPFEAVVLTPAGETRPRWMTPLSEDEG